MTVDGAPALKAAAQVATGSAVVVADDRPLWASRGGHKLEGALDDLQLSPAGRHCLDAGASTGGFTDVLLQRGAARVVAVDVGYGQLLWRLRNDPRVVVLDRTNVRHLTPADVPAPPPDLIVADLSFISLRLVLPALAAVAAPEADLLLLVKPQFEVGPESIGKGGVVRDPEAWRRALEGVLDAAAEQGLHAAGGTVSRLPGPAGNIEFFLHLRADADPAGRGAAVASALAAAEEVSRG